MMGNLVICSFSGPIDFYVDLCGFGLSGRYWEVIGMLGNYDCRCDLPPCDRGNFEVQRITSSTEVVGRGEIYR